MKFSIHIFALYMLSLSLLPCGDGGGGLMDILQHVFNIEHKDHTDHDQHSNTCGDDHCSPFCICSCCSSVLDYPTKHPLSVNLPASIPGNAPTFIPNIILSSFMPNVWQPPKSS